MQGKNNKFRKTTEEIAWYESYIMQIMVII